MQRRGSHDKPVMPRTDVMRAHSRAPRYHPLIASSITWLSVSYTVWGSIIVTGPAMTSYTALWIEANRDAEKLRRLSKKYKNSYKATLLKLGSLLLEEIAEAFFSGRIDEPTLEKAEILERLYRRNRIPEEQVIRRYRILASKLLRKYVYPPGLATYSREYAYIIGV